MDHQGAKDIDPEAHCSMTSTPKISARHTVSHALGRSVAVPRHTAGADAPV